MDRPVCSPARAGSGLCSPGPAKRRCTSEAPSAALRDLEAVVVNLDRRPDRMEDCAKRIRARCPWLRYQRFGATDGKRDAISAEEVSSEWHTGRNVEYQILRSKRKGWNDLDSYKVRQLTLSPGERGCALSHVRAWRRCLAECGGEERPLMVLEDDAAPTPEFTPLLARAMANLPSDAHVLYLGYSQAAEWRREVVPELVEAEYVWTTVGYIVWPAGARLLLSMLPIDQPVDNWMAVACADRHLKAYCVRPKIILQADQWNVNSDVGHSDEFYWGSDSNIRHSDALDWGNADDKKVGGSGLAFFDIGDSDSEEEEDDISNGGSL